MQLIFSCFNGNISGADTSAQEAINVLRHGLVVYKPNVLSNICVLDFIFLLCALRDCDNFLLATCQALRLSHAPALI